MSWTELLAFVSGFCFGAAFAMIWMITSILDRVKREFVTASEKLKRWRVIGK